MARLTPMFIWTAKRAPGERHRFVESDAYRLCTRAIFQLHEKPQPRSNLTNLLDLEMVGDTFRICLDGRQIRQGV
jgi:hypothetical protein